MSKRYYRPKKYRRNTTSTRIERKKKKGTWLIPMLCGIIIALLFVYVDYQARKDCHEEYGLEEIDWKIIFKEDTKLQEETIVIPQKEYKEVSLDYWNSCSGLELEAQMEDISEGLRKELYCKSLCGLHELEYEYFECRLDKIYCYCEK